MEERFKICPECGAEYFPHISECGGCAVKLIYPEEKDAWKKDLPKGEGTLVCIEEGTIERVTEFARALRAEGISSEVLKAVAGKSCSTGGDYGLFVEQNVARHAAQAIDEYIDRLYPELRQAEERMESGLCPACGSPVKQTDQECPDCGLYLGGGYGGGADSCGGGTCGPGCR